MSSRSIAALLLVAILICGCTLSSNVNSRKPGEPWHYYGYLRDFYRDENHGYAVSLVWYDLVSYQNVPRGDFLNAIKTLRKQGYRKIGFISVLTSAIVDLYDVKSLAADQGAQQVVACTFPVGKDPGIKPIIANVRNGHLGHPQYDFELTPANIARTQHWYQLLGK
jgi:hypothetical protein